MTQKKVTRREVLGVLGAAGAAALSVRCGGETPTSPTATTTTDVTTTGGTSSGACAVTPSETIGPYPSLTDMIRSDIREGRTGTLLTLTMTVANTNNACGPLSGATVDIWQCDAEGHYSQVLAGGLRRTGLDVPARHADHRQQRSRDVHDGVPRVVPRARDAHPRRGAGQRAVREGDPDRVPGERQRRGVWEWRVCRARAELHDQQRATGSSRTASTRKRPP